MPDHVGDRGAAHLDPGASRSPTYQADPDVRGQADHTTSRTQITRFGVASGDHLSNQAAEQIGGDARAHRHQDR